jgi:2'-5' RNA ligase
MRLFFAVLLPDEIVSRVTEFQNDLKGLITDSGVKWSRPEQFHFTLKFLGETSPERIEKVLMAGKAVASVRNPFEITVGGLSAFPNNRRPSTLWLGATEGADSFAELALQLDGLLVKYGHGKESRPPTPHITLARIKTYSGETETARVLRTPEAGEIGTTTIDGFVLMQSTLKPTGSEYRVVEEFTFLNRC